LNKKPVYYWNQDVIDGLPGWKAKIYFSGNFLLWWLGVFSLIIITIKSLTKKGRKKVSPLFYFLIIGYLSNLLPFIFIERVSFLYHYLPPTIYANLLCALLLANLWPQNKKIFIGIFSLILLAFLILAPFSYGWPLPPMLNDFEIHLISFFN
jgi:dolichyl-phosphate-mannose--protein O-mannosyl transferase